MKPPDDLKFSEPWEAQAFAMVISLHARGVFTWSEWAQTLAAQIAADPHRRYYESWLAALEHIVEAKHVMQNAERLDRIDAWDRAARATPHGRPIELKSGA